MVAVSALLSELLLTLLNFLKKALIKAQDTNRVAKSAITIRAPHHGTAAFEGKASKRFGR